jgi:hypothetical protein
MAILKIKRLVEDLVNDTHQVLTDNVAKATSAGNTGTASLASSASYAGTARVAHFASSGTANIAGTSEVWSTGGL